MKVEISFFKELFERALDSVWVVNENGIIEFINPACEILTGYDAKELIGFDFKNLIAQQNTLELNKDYNLNQKNNEINNIINPIFITGTREFSLKTKENTIIPVEMKSFELHSTKDGSRMFAGIMRDIQFRKSLEENQRMTMATLKKLAFIDELTMIPNRRSFYDSFRKLIATNIRHNRHATLAIVDIDNFKEINDTYGHDIGDLVLRNISKAFIENLREEDTVGRIGGEEFGFLLPETDDEGAYRVLERLRLAVKHYRFFVFENFYLNVTISLGYVRFGQTQTLEQVIKCADIALYKSKNSGKDTLSKF